MAGATLTSDNSQNFQSEQLRKIEEQILERLGSLLAGCAAKLIDLMMLQTKSLISLTYDYKALTEFVSSVIAALNYTNIETMVSLSIFQQLWLFSISIEQASCRGIAGYWLEQRHKLGKTKYSL